MKRERFEHIDLLRAFAIVGMMAIHTLQYNLAGPLQYFFWNYLHFVEALFVFCSGYVLTAHYHDKFPHLMATFRWYAKRIKRLLVPFYIYLFSHFILWILFPNFFSGLGLTKSISFIWQSIFLVGGASANWLVLLFLELTILFPVFIRLVKNKKLLIIFLILALMETVFFTVHDFNNSYRYLMWIPWSMIYIFSVLVSQSEKVKVIYKSYFSNGLIGLGIFFFLYAIWGETGKSLRLIDNKYPPNLFYLTFSFGMTSIAFVISNARLLLSKNLNKIWHYISRNSYQLFFVHFIVLDLVIKTTTNHPFWSNVLMQLVLVLGGSILAIFMLQTIKQFYAIIASYNKTN